MNYCQFIRAIEKEVVGVSITRNILLEFTKSRFIDMVEVKITIIIFPSIRTNYFDRSASTIFELGAFHAYLIYDATLNYLAYNENRG